MIFGLASILRERRHVLNHRDGVRREDFTRRELVSHTVSYSPRAMRDADVRTLTQRLVHDTVTFSEADKSGNLVFGRVCRKIKVQPDALKPNRCVFGYPERAAKI